MASYQPLLAEEEPQRAIVARVIILDVESRHDSFHVERSYYFNDGPTAIKYCKDLAEAIYQSYEGKVHELKRQDVDEKCEILIQGFNRGFMGLCQDMVCFHRLTISVNTFDAPAPVEESFAEIMKHLRD